MSNLSNENQSKINENNIHSNTIECLKYCTNYNLLITRHQNNFKDNLNFSKISYAHKNDIFLVNNYSSPEIIKTISENSINNNKNLLISSNYESLFNKSFIDKSIKETIIKYPLEPEIIGINFIDISKKIDNHLNNKGLNLLVKFDVNKDKNCIVFDKNIIYNLLSFRISGKIHNYNLFLKNDTIILLDIKKIVKSIQIHLENIQKLKLQQFYNIENIFVPLLEYQNIGIIISTNSQFSPINIMEMKTNFNSIVKQKFILKSIVISFNISSLFKNITVNINNDSIIKINENNNKEKSIDFNNDETTSSSSNNSPKLTYEKINENLNAPLKGNFFLFNNFTNNNLNFKNNNNKKYINNYLNYNYKNNIKCQYLKSNSNKNNIQFYNNNNNFNKYGNQKNNNYHKNIDINTTIINSNDLFSKTLFNRYQDKSNSTCNLKILIEFLKIKMKKPLSELTIFDFFSSFSNIGSFSLKIPLFNKDGTILRVSLTATLQELKIYIKNQKYIKKIEKKLKLNKTETENTSSSPQLNDNNLHKEIEGFTISILEDRTLLAISYKENKPYYLTESLFEKFEQLMNLFKCLRKINIEEGILVDKSFIIIRWNSINSHNILSSSFNFYYLFNGNFIGLLSDLKENEKYFWLNSIEEMDNKRTKINYNYLIEENYLKVYDYINNNK